MLGSYRGAMMISFFKIATTCEPSDWLTTGAVTYMFYGPLAPSVAYPSVQNGTRVPDSLHRHVEGT